VAGPTGLNGLPRARDLRITAAPIAWSTTTHHNEQARSMGTEKNSQQDRAGVEESQQDQRQDDVAKQRPGQQDEQIRDAHSKKPVRKDGSGEPA